MTPHFSMNINALQLTKMRKKIRSNDWLAACSSLRLILLVATILLHRASLVTSAPFKNATVGHKVHPGKTTPPPVLMERKRKALQLCAVGNYCDLRNKGLTEVASLPLGNDIISLDLTGNQLHDLCRPAGWPPKLKKLTLVNSGLRNFRCMGSLPGTLEFLDVSFNNVVNVDGVQWPSGLLDLQMNNVGITGVFTPMHLPNNVRRLYVRHNFITDFGDNIKWPDGLDDLTFMNNSLRVLQHQNYPAMIRSISYGHNALSEETFSNQIWPSGLREIWAYNCNLTRIPPNLPGTLNTLHLFGNQITTIHNHLLPISSDLSTLTFHENKLNSVDGVVWPTNIKLLSLLDNKITSFPTNAWPDSIQELGLSNNFATSIDGQAWPSSLVRLLLDNMKLTTIEGQVWPTKLTTIDLSNNFIVSIVSQKWPTGLTVLNLNSNRINSIRGCQWPLKLRSLPLFGNQISDVGTQVWPARIEKIQLGTNLIPEVSTESFLLGKNSKLEEIDLSSNELTTIDGVQWPNQVTLINLQLNQIDQLPSVPTWPVQLQSLLLNFNPFAHVLRKSIDKIAGDTLPDLTTGVSCITTAFEIDGKSAPWACNRLPICDDLLVTSTTPIPEPAGSPLKPSSGKPTALPANGLDAFKAYINNLVEAQGMVVLSPLFAYAADPTYTAVLTKAQTTGINSLTSEDVQLLMTISEVQDMATAGGFDNVIIVQTIEVVSNISVAEGWECVLTDNGESLVQALPEYRAQALELSDTRYKGFYAASIPLSILGAAFGYSKSPHRGKFFWFVFLLNMFDICSDWAFFALEIGSTGFQNSYECIPTAPLQQCDAEGTNYDCSSLGILKDPCLGSKSAKRSDDGTLLAVNACECEGLPCVYGGQQYIWKNTDNACDDDCGFGLDTCDPVATGCVDGTTVVTKHPASCFGFDEQTSSIEAECGWFNHKNPDASGSNECECRGHSCVDIEFTGGECIGAYGGDYKALYGMHLIFVLVATCLWVAHWRLYFPPISFLPGFTGVEVSSESMVRLAVSIIFFEDCAQLIFQFIYFSVMGAKAGVAVLSTISTVASAVVSLFVLAHNHQEHIRDNWGSFAEYFIAVFTCWGYIAKTASYVNERRNSSAKRGSTSSVISVEPSWFSHSSENNGAIGNIEKEKEKEKKKKGLIVAMQSVSHILKGSGTTWKESDKGVRVSVSGFCKVSRAVSSDSDGVLPWETSMNRKQAEALLTNQAGNVGAFVTRPSQKASSGHVLVHLNRSGKIMHNLIHRTQNGQVSLQNKNAEDGFPDIQHLVEAAQLATIPGLTVPLVSATFVASNQPWATLFDRHQSEHVLKGKPDGTFVIRLSSKGSTSGFVLTYIYDGKPRHATIEKEKHTFCIPGSGSQHKSITEMVNVACQEDSMKLGTILVAQPSIKKSRSKSSRSTSAGEYIGVVAESEQFDGFGEFKKVERKPSRLRV
eukprot:gene11153-20424_t